MNIQRFIALLAVLLSVLNLSACGGGNDSASAGSAVTQLTVGKKIFFDTTLSSHANQSCASCHDPAHGFADPAVSQSAPVSEGSVPGAFGNRNAPTVGYASLIPNFGLSTTQHPETDSKYQGGQFLDGRRPDLVAQAKDPFLNPAEMNNIDAADVVSKVQNASYASEFIAVFGADAFDDIPTAYNHIATALSAFESSLEVNPFTSKFDAVMASQASFTASEQRGFDLFKGDRAKCANCHTVNSPDAAFSLFTDFKYFNIGTPANPDNPVYITNSTFVDEGLASNPNIDAADTTTERGKFRTPTLRNVELTAPYMHNGVYATLNEVITHYDITVPNADGFGALNPEVTENIAAELNFGSYTVLGLTPEEYTDLENFMLTLTDGYI